eukprot:3174798-Amphidinium_carterae.1
MSKELAPHAHDFQALPILCSNTHATIDEHVTSVQYYGNDHKHMYNANPVSTSGVQTSKCHLTWQGPSNVSLAQGGKRATGARVWNSFKH